MTELELFTARGGVTATDNFGEKETFAAHFGDYAAECDNFDQSAGLCAVGRVGLLRITGTDATTFLHNLLSTNVKALPAGRGHYTTLNSPKGRMLVSLFLWRAPETDVHAEPVFYAYLAHDLVANVLKRLKMFVLRAKVSLEDISDHFAALGICGARTRDRATIFMEPALNDGEVFERASTFILALPANRRLILCAPERIEEYWNAGTPSLLPSGRDLWQRAAILSGISMITTPTADKLIPLEANWDVLGGVDFNKGCYPGQEIIARTRYLGRLKTRLYLARTNVSDRICPALPVYSLTFGAQSCGMVVNAAPDRTGQILLVALRTDADSGTLRLGAEDGAPLTLLPLPYKLKGEE